MFKIILKNLREDKGLSQAALAKILCVGQSTIGMWEAGKREPNFERIKEIAGFFDVSTDYLLGKTDIKLSTPSIKEPPKKEISLEEFLLMQGIEDKKIVDSFQNMLELAKKVANNKNLDNEVANEFITKD